MYKIFIVEDDATVSSIISEKLNKWGFEAVAATDFKNLVAQFGSASPHLVLLDINLPFYDGFYWCEQIRRVSTIPIIFISSRADDNDKIRAILGGGDDYIEKPFSMDVLVAKIQGALRRAYSYTDVSYSVLSYSDIVLDLEKMAATNGEKQTTLTQNETRILSLLIKASGKTVSRAKIIKTLWQDENFVDENTLTVNINRLRSKLKQIKDEDLIETVKGTGYKLL
jgi:DNA-binding response OmpR family regulator